MGILNVLLWLMGIMFFVGLVGIGWWIWGLVAPGVSSNVQAAKVHDTRQSDRLGQISFALAIGGLVGWTLVLQAVRVPLVFPIVTGVLAAIFGIYAIYGIRSNSRLYLVRVPMVLACLMGWISLVSSAIYFIVH